jgi:hypothetical protein
LDLVFLADLHPGVISFCQVFIRFPPSYLHVIYCLDSAELTENNFNSSRRSDKLTSRII